MASLGVISYALSAAGYFILSLLLIISWRGRVEGIVLLFATVLQTAWGVLLALHSYVPFISIPWLSFLEVLRLGIWIFFLMRLLTVGQHKRLPTFLSLSVSLILVLAIFVSVINVITNTQLLFGTNIVLIMLLVQAILGLILSEQLYRNIKPEKRWSLKYLCIAIASLFIYDLYMYSDAMMFSMLDPDIWGTRGIINALIVPFLALSAARNPNWSFDIFVSRQVVFYSTGLLAVGAYLTLMAIGGYYIKFYGGEWGRVIQIMFFFGAAAVLFIVLSSSKTRSKIKVFLTKHFYKNKYDYREEWLKLIHNISEYKSPTYFYEQVIQTVAGLLQCQGGHIFIEDDSNTFRCKSSWNSQHIGHSVQASSSLALFLNKYEWVVDVSEYKRNAKLYRNLVLPEWVLENNNYWLIIPLKHQYKLLGFILILKSNVHDHVNWEDRDLLKAVERQVSSYMAFIKASEELGEAQQFSAFNRLSAYIVHDLKNLVAQLELVVKNAETYKTDPEFVKDAMLTVDNVVRRMQKMLGQLRKVSFDKRQDTRLNVKDALLAAIERCTANEPRPELIIKTNRAYVYVDAERFIDIIEHLVQNAQEATPSDGYVKIKLMRKEEYILIEIGDNGAGMDELFIQNRLFRPFDTTKGNAGMGIGVFEAREFIKYYDGEIEVTSAPGVGTCFQLKIPSAEMG